MQSNNIEIQKEAFIFLIQKILESTRNPQREKILGELKVRLFNADFSLDVIIKNSDYISKLLGISRTSFEDYLSKNFFKSLQYLKKQKESFGLSIKDEKTSIIQLIAQNFTKLDLSSGFFKHIDDAYILVYNNQEIPEIHLQNQSLPQEIELSQKPSIEKTIQISEEEVSIIQEIINKFINQLKIPEQLLLKEEPQNDDDFSIDIDDSSPNEPETIRGEMSIIEEIIIKFEDIIKANQDNIQKIREKMQEEEISDLDSIEILENKNDFQKDFSRIPFTFSEYLELRNKIQYFQIHKKMNEYQNFIQSSREVIKAIIGILNILTKEKTDPDFNENLYLESLSEKLAFSIEELKDLYYRIKNYNLCLSYLKKIEISLKEQNQLFYQYFLNINSQIINFLSLYSENYDFESYINENIDFLLISIKNEDHKIKFKNYLEKVFLNLKPYLCFE